MSPALALAAVAALLALATLVGLALRRREGRRRNGGDLRFEPADAAGAAFGPSATLVQFSTEMCTRCPQVRRLLGAYAAETTGLAHIEVDLTHRPDLSARYRVLQTPTTFLVDASGVVRARFGGVPARDALATAVATLV
ncbi:thioredoxin family protein [Microbacterium paraoxydans]|uniref:TlpA family protein disulfide reductase n=1 Tax=Microbacterium paraoxydans TaxID=199592 RepID=UPI00228658ED|nr:thioredoxin family protein [Microbacterium paraoxydans]MCZ0708885.1 thioredoxin family protein [Microbacterium paraoxydans]